MYKVTVTVDADVLQALEDAYAKSPRTIKTFLNRSLLPQYIKRIQQQWTPYPGAVRYPIQWASDKQRRAFFATNGFGGGIPYRRTRNLQKSWVFAIDEYPNGEEVSIGNTADYARYVIGAEQQPFHSNTGWPRIDDEAAALTNELTDEVIDLYFQIMDGTFA
jgi:hypothetical protein